MRLHKENPERLEKYKASFVGSRFSEIKGLNYKKTFSSAADITLIRFNENCGTIGFYLIEVLTDANKRPLNG